MYTNKWITFVACIPAMLSSGVTYSFAVWSDSLKTTYQLDQTHLQAIGSACNLGGYAAIVAGLFYDSLQRFDRLGPRLTLLIGAAINLTGYLGLWAAATRQFEAQYWQLLLFAFIACNGGTWTDAACLVTNVRNFPSNRGVVVGVMKSGVGLSASFYTAMYLGLLQPNTSAYLLFLACVPAGAALLAALFTNHVPYVQRSELDEEQRVFSTGGRFLFAFQVMGTLALYLATTAVASSILPVTPELRLGFAVGAGVLLLPLLAVPLGSGGLRAAPAHPRWRDAEEGHLYPRAQHRRHLRVGRLVVNPDPDSLEAPLLSSARGDSPHIPPSPRISPLPRLLLGQGGAAGPAALASPNLTISSHATISSHPIDSTGSLSSTSSLEEAAASPPAAASPLRARQGVANPSAVTSPVVASHPVSDDDDEMAEPSPAPRAAAAAAAAATAAAKAAAKLQGGSPARGRRSPAGSPIAAKAPSPAAKAAEQQGGSSRGLPPRPRQLLQQQQQLPSPLGRSSAQPSPPSSRPSQAPSLRKERREVDGAEDQPCSPSVTPLGCLISLNFWLLFLCCLVGMGAGLVFNNNLAQIVLALGGKPDGQDVFVSLFGVCNCAGRLLMGYLPERMLHSSGTPRPVFLMLATCLTTAACLLLAYAHLSALYPLSLLSGLAFGSYWSLMPSLASELFGLPHFASIYTLLQFAPAIGSIGLASKLAGFLYEAAMQRQQQLGTTCVGQECYQLTFLIVAGLGVLSTLCSVWLYSRTREHYYRVTFVEVHQHDHEMEGQHLLPAGQEGGEQRKEEGSSRQGA